MPPPGTQRHVPYLAKLVSSHSHSHFPTRAPPHLLRSPNALHPLNPMPDQPPSQKSLTRQETLIATWYLPAQAKPSQTQPNPAKPSQPNTTLLAPQSIEISYKPPTNPPTTPSPHQPLHIPNPPPNIPHPAPQIQAPGQRMPQPADEPPATAVVMRGIGALARRRGRRLCCGEGRCGGRLVGIGGWIWVLGGGISVWGLDGRGRVLRGRRRSVV